jgi:hypothetical protein
MLTEHHAMNMYCGEEYSPTYSEEHTQMRAKLRSPTA